MCERLDAGQGYWKRSTDRHERKGVPGTRRSAHFLERIPSPALDKALGVSVPLSAGLCERCDALQGCWKSSTEGHEDKYAPNTRRRVRFLERIQSHISSVLGSEDCRSSVHSQTQEPLLRPGGFLGSMSSIADAHLCLLPSGDIRKGCASWSGFRATSAACCSALCTADGDPLLRPSEHPTPLPI